MGTKLSWELFEPLFGTWAERFKPFFDNGEFDPIYERLKSLTSRGKRVAPLSSDVFRCFQETPFDDMKVIMVGMCPYHTFTGWGSKLDPNNSKESKIVPVADGLALSCSVTKRLQPSLLQWYMAAEKELNNGEESKRDPDLLFLAKQGVLLLNTALTVEEGKPLSHNSLWEPFMKYLFEEVLITNGIPIILLGKEASKMTRYIMPFTWVFEVSHPASASYNNSQWSSEGVFGKVNQILKQNNNNEIQWFKTE
jgi:uracil-DNA glycosylase